MGVGYHRMKHADHGVTVRCVETATREYRLQSYSCKDYIVLIEDGWGCLVPSR